MERPDIIFCTVQVCQRLILKQDEKYQFFIFKVIWLKFFGSWDLARFLRIQISGSWRNVDIFSGSRSQKTFADLRHKGIFQIIIFFQGDGLRWHRSYRSWPGSSATHFFAKRTITTQTRSVPSQLCLSLIRLSHNGQPWLK